MARKSPQRFGRDCRYPVRERCFPFSGECGRALDRAGVPYMIAGSFASSHHGSPRTTHDIDVVVDASFDSLDRFLKELAGKDIYFDVDVANDEFKRRGQFNLIDSKTGWLRLATIHRAGRKRWIQL